MRPSWTNQNLPLKGGAVTWWLPHEGQWKTHPGAVDKWPAVYAWVDWHSPVLGDLTLFGEAQRCFQISLIKEAAAGLTQASESCEGLEGSEPRTPLEGLEMIMIMQGQRLLHPP